MHSRRQSFFFVIITKKMKPGHGTTGSRVQLCHRYKAFLLSHAHRGRLIMGTNAT